MSEFEHKYTIYLQQSPTETKFCELQAVECPENIFDNCTVRDEGLELEGQLRSVQDTKTRHQLEEKHEELLKDPCPLESAVGAKVNQ